MDVSKTHTTNASLKWLIIFIAIISIALLSYPAKAETGSITVSNETGVYFRPEQTATGLQSIHQENFTQFWFDTGNYTTLVNFTIHDSNNALTYTHASEVTTFTCVTNCTGSSGTASYSATLKQLNWVFPSNFRVIGSPFKISYSHNIFLNTSLPGADGVNYFAERPATANPFGRINRTYPMYVFNSTGVGNNQLANFVLGAAAKTINQSGIFGTGSVTVGYNVTYPIAGWFVADINKTGTTVNTKVNTHSQTNNSASYETETTFNNDTLVSFMAQQTDGIYINVTMQTGDFNDVLINASGSTLAPITPPNASDPNNPNCVVNCIITSKPTYNNTESVNVYGSFYPATTTVTDCLFFGFICTDTTISTESTTGYVFISTQGSTSPIKFLSFTPDLNNNYNLFTNLDIGTYQAQLVGFAGPGSTCTNGIVYDFPFIPLGCYYPHNITNFRVVNASGNLSIVWQTKLSNSTAIYGDTVTVAWSNVTANDTVRIYDEDHVLLQSYNINQSTVSQLPVFIPLYHIGQFNATIFNGSNILHNATAYLNVVPPGSVDVNNSFGITMYWSKAADVINNPTFLNWNTGTYTGKYNISILKDGTEVRRNSYYGVPGQAQQASYTFGEQGAYIAQFLDFPNQTVQAQADILISATTTTGGGTGGTTNESGNNLVGSSNLILNIPWIGLMVLIVVIFGLVKNNVQGGNFVFAVAITTSIEAVIGLWEEWGIYITVLSWLLVGLFFKLNKAIEV